MKNWEKTETFVAKKIKGNRVAGSGNGRFKGDVSNSKYLIEVKETSKDYINLKIIWINKIYSEALFKRKVPVLVVEFGNKEILVLILIEPEDLISDDSIIDWSAKITIKLKPEDLDVGSKILIGGKIWKVIDINDL